MGLSTRQIEFCCQLAKFNSCNTADVQFPHVSVLTVEYADVSHHPAFKDRRILVAGVGGRDVPGFAYKCPTVLVKQAPMTRLI